MQYLFRRLIKDFDTKEVKEIEQKLDPSEIACYYRDSNSYYISTKGGKVMKLVGTFDDIEMVADDLED